MTRRWVPEDGLLRVLRGVLRGSPVADSVTAAVTRYMARQPKQPDLVGATAAAKILGIPPPHIARLKAQGRLPEPVRVDGSVEVYHRDDIVALAVVLRAERQERAERKAAGRA